jgi:glycosyltransferase involved in cell wall biosynthesis
LLQKCKDISPNLLIISGRVDRDYLSVGRYFKARILTVTIQDTQFSNSIKVRLQTLFSYFLYRRYFSAFWGCGDSGSCFARALGFKDDLIFKNAYSANSDLFMPYRNSFSNKTILFVGRLVYVKNINFLIVNFLEANKLNGDKWNLVIVGTGELEAIVKNHRNVIHIPYMSQKELSDYVTKVDVFCLPSLNEPWGVVVHEFASMGLPLLLSKNVGSRKEFLIDGFNGFTFDPSSAAEFISSLNHIMNSSPDELRIMGNNSIRLASRISTEIWAATLFQLSLKSNNF